MIVDQRDYLRRSKYVKKLKNKKSPNLKEILVQDLSKSEHVLRNTGVVTPELMVLMHHISALKLLLKGRSHYSRILEETDGAYS